MTSNDKDLLLTSIYDAAYKVINLYGTSEVNFVLLKYNATCIEDLSPCYYCDVFDELDFRANDN